jgi:hypothetical protein
VGLIGGPEASSHPDFSGVLCQKRHGAGMSICNLYYVEGGGSEGRKRLGLSKAYREQSGCGLLPAPFLVARRVPGLARELPCSANTPGEAMDSATA